MMSTSPNPELDNPDPQWMKAEDDDGYDNLKLWKLAVNTLIDVLPTIQEEGRKGPFRYLLHFFAALEELELGEAVHLENEYISSNEDVCEYHRVCVATNKERHGNIGRLAFPTETPKALRQYKRKRVTFDPVVIPEYILLLCNIRPSGDDICSSLTGNFDKGMCATLRKLLDVGTRDDAIKSLETWRDKVMAEYKAPLATPEDKKKEENKKRKVVPEIKKVVKRKKARAP